MYRQFNIQQFYVLPTLAVFICFVWIWEQTAIISLFNINRVVFITENACIYCEVRTKYFCIIYVNFRLQSSLCHCWGRDIGLSQHSPLFNPMSVHVTFLVPEVAFGQIFIPALQFCPISVIPPLLRTHFRLHVALTRRTNVRSLWTF